MSSTTPSSTVVAAAVEKKEPKNIYEIYLQRQTRKQAKMQRRLDARKPLDQIPRCSTCNLFKCKPEYHCTICGKSSCRSYNHCSLCGVAGHKASHHACGVQDCKKAHTFAYHRCKQCGECGCDVVKHCKRCGRSGCNAAYHCCVFCAGAHRTSDHTCELPFCGYKGHDQFSDAFHTVCAVCGITHFAGGAFEFKCPNPFQIKCKLCGARHRHLPQNCPSVCSGCGSKSHHIDQHMCRGCGKTGHVFADCPSMKVIDQRSDREQ